MHVHVSSPDGEAKFWLKPILSLVTSRQLARMQRVVEESHAAIVRAWRTHFG